MTMQLLKENFKFAINLSKHLLYIAYLIVFCMIGVLIRILLSDTLYKPSLSSSNNNSNNNNIMNPSTSSNGNIVQSIDDLFFSDLYANIVGCFIMGVLMVIHLHFIKKPLEELKEKEKALLVELEKNKVTNNNNNGSSSESNTPIMVKSNNSSAISLEGMEESKKRMVKLFLHRVFHGTLSFEKRIYTGLSTGMCGCITTFSSWQVNAAISLMKGDVLSFVSKQVVGFTTCYFAFVIAKDITNAILSFVIPVLRKKFGNAKAPQQVTMTSQNSVNSIASSSVASGLAEDVDIVEPIPNEDQRKILLEEGEIKYIAESNGELFKRKLLEEYQQIRNAKWKSRTAIKMAVDLFVVLMAVISVFIVLLGAMNVSKSLDQSLCLTLLVAPLGCLLRYLICKLNITFKAVERFQMPIFTLAVNIIGSLILVILQGTAYVSGFTSGVAVYWIDAFSVGFCGSLTTVSTFIQEVYGLNHTFKKYLYSLSSIFWTTLVVSTCLILFMWIL
ncbi:predicted protein [Naegleria gruberi]|uniref:Predicted protein n=1 Tax=Naegleria gruberi TaxID=5762 RepID=D2W3G1_NAEGR|nr:uncharacterized protein NAEGRDRAFT_82231 [Naegleria gruberi]EFC36416.1 predicted protein [Naegleria gruberi]|eukprot:XP_002669160.1 predicted protein [Naegleria gruberi strain NEG-M]